MNKKTVEDVDLRGKKVLVRCDFNVPLDENRKITDNRRIVAALPTIQYLLERDCKVILCSHLGRPKGEVNPEFSLDVVAEELSRLLGQEVKLSKDVAGPDSVELASNLQPRQVMMLENTRFEKGEEKNDEELSKRLASLAEIYVNDAFGTAHRAHSSTTGVASYLPAVSGFLIEKELKNLGDALDDPERPLVAVLGGSKVSDKIGVIDALLEKADTIIIGGAMTYTFYKALGLNVGDSKCEPDKVDVAKDIIRNAKKKNVKIKLPIDIKVAKEFSNDAESMTVNFNEMPDGYQGLDIGEKTIKEFIEELSKAGTIIWNGPVGVFEFPNFAIGTNSLAEAMAEMKSVRIIGGGDSAAAVEKLGLSDKFTHVSTGGGASLEFIEGKELPGIAALQDKEKTITNPHMIKIEEGETAPIPTVNSGMPIGPINNQPIVNPIKEDPSSGNPNMRAMTIDNGDIER